MSSSSSLFYVSNNCGAFISPKEWDRFGHGVLLAAVSEMPPQTRATAAGGLHLECSGYMYICIYSKLSSIYIVPFTTLEYPESSYNS